MISKERVNSVAKSEVKKIVRNLVIWLNEFPNLPVGVINIEPMLYSAPGMAIITVSSNIVTYYITGGHKAEIQFGIVYRINPGTSPNKRLEAREMLESIGEWAEINKPNLGEEINTLKVISSPSAEFLTPYDNGNEDYQILMKLTYEVI